MRILFAASNRATVGGVETYLRALLPALSERGHELALLHEYDAAPNEPTIDDGLVEFPRWQVGEAALLRASAWGPDLCYLHGLDSPETEEELVRRFPTILFAHNYHGTCISGAKRHAFPWAQPCERELGPACLGLYLPRRCGGLNPLTMVRQYQVQQRRRALLPRYRGVLVASEHMRAEYARHGVSSDRLHVAPLFPPGVERDLEPPADRPLSGRVLLIGRLTPLKGGTYLVRALADASRVLGRKLTLVVAGDGPERLQLECEAQRRNVPGEFHGWVNRQTCVRLMRSADLLAVPSVWPEPFGLVGVEAACVGLPAVAYDVGGLADALIRALRDAATLTRLRLGAWGIAHGFTRQEHLVRLEAVLSEIVANQQRTEINRIDQLCGS